MTAPPKLDSSNKTTVYLLLVLRIVVVVAVGVGGRFGLDTHRIRALGERSGTPYVDYKVEYPPGFLLTTRLIADESIERTGLNTAVLCLLVDASAAWLILRMAGSQACKRYLFLGSLMLPYSYLTLDFLPVFLTVLAFYLTFTHRARSGGVALGIAIMTKVWPAVTIGAFVATRRWTAAAWCIVTSFVSGLAWIAITGSEGISQVIGFRGASGWEVGSPVGIMYQVFADQEIVFDGGANRVGFAPSWAKVLLLLFAAAVIIGAVVAPRARNLPSVVAGVCVSALLLGSPLFSLQFALWLVPFAALYRARSLTLVCAVAQVGSLLGFIYFYKVSSPGGAFESIMTVRVLATAAFVVAGLRLLYQASSRTRRIEIDPLVLLQR